MSEDDNEGRSNQKPSTFNPRSILPGGTAPAALSATISALEWI